MRFRSGKVSFSFTNHCDITWCSLLSTQGPSRASQSRPLKQIPVGIYREIFLWLRPAVRQDMDQRSYLRILRVLSLVCRYFAYYVAYELPRHQEFSGFSQCSVASHPGGPFYTGILERRQPWESMRHLIEECKVSHWFPGVGMDYYGGFVQEASISLRQLALVLSRLDNLRALTLSETSISYYLLQSLGRLKKLHQLAFSACFMGAVDVDCPREFISGIHGTPFPALSKLTITGTDHRTTPVFQDALVVLGSAPTLRLVTITDSNWLSLFLPLLSPNLVSLTGNFSLVGGDAFLQFVKGHAALEHLTMYFQKFELFFFKDEYPLATREIRWDNVDPDLIFPFPSNGQHLDASHLPALRSFSGPFHLAPEFIRDRPVSKLALGSHLEPINPDMPFLRGLTVLPQTCATTTHTSDHDILITADDKIWKGLETIGGNIQELFLRFHVEMSPSVIASCFPNLVKLQLNLLISIGVSHVHEYIHPSGFDETIFNRLWTIRLTVEYKMISFRPWAKLCRI